MCNIFCLNIKGPVLKLKQDALWHYLNWCPSRNEESRWCEAAGRGLQPNNTSEAGSWRLMVPMLYHKQLFIPPSVLSVLSFMYVKTIQIRTTLVPFKDTNMSSLTKDNFLFMVCTKKAKKSSSLRKGNKCCNIYPDYILQYVMRDRHQSWLVVDITLHSRPTHKATLLVWIQYNSIKYVIYLWELVSGKWKVCSPLISDLCNVKP